MTSYLSENEAKSLQSGDVHIAQIPDFETEPFGTLRSVMARFFFIFHASSFELNFFFDRRFPLRPTRSSDIYNPGGAPCGIC